MLIIFYPGLNSFHQYIVLSFLNAFSQLFCNSLNFLFPIYCSALFCGLICRVHCKSNGVQMVIKTTMLLTILMSEKLCMLSYVNITTHMTGDIHKIQKQLSYMHRSILYHWLYLLIKSKRKNDDSLRTNIFLQTYRISYRNKFFQKEFNLRLYEDLKQKKKNGF